MDITTFVRSCVKDFQAFVGIDSFPAFIIKTKEITMDKAIKQGYEAPASAYYDTSTGLHSLEIWSKLSLPQMNAKYLVFHELTHIWDAEVYSRKDKVKHMSNKGYTEYHASQIDLLELLGVKNTAQPISFNMNQTVNTFSGTKTVKAYVDEARTLAIELIQRDDFPANIATLATTLGIIFNYYGRRSICKIHATNFEDNADMSVISAFIGENGDSTINALNNFMLGWLEPERVAFIDKLYHDMTFYLLKKYKLS